MSETERLELKIDTLAKEIRNNNDLLIKLNVEADYIKKSIDEHGESIEQYKQDRANIVGGITVLSSLIAFFTSLFTSNK